MKQWRLRIILSIFLGLGALGIISGPALASLEFRSNSNYSAPDCHDVEIVFVIDQSGSMGGSAGHPDPNDPLGLRFFGPIFGARWMGNYYLSTNGSPIPGRPQVTFHMAAVSFGDTATVTLPWTTIDPNDQASWSSMRAKLEHQLGPEGLQGRSDLGNTNFVDAFQRTADLFGQRARPQNECPHRAIVLLTDGQPKLPQAFTIADHMAGVKQIFKDSFPSPEYSFYVTAINDYAADKYWVTMEPYWKDILDSYPIGDVPGALKVNSEDGIGDRFNKILYDLTNRTPPPPTDLGTHTVPPYLQAIVFTIFKQSTNEHLVLTDGVRLISETHTVEIIGYDEPIETWIVHRPLPGVWNLGTTAGRGDVTITEDRIPAAVWLRSPSGGSLQFVQTPLEFQLVDSTQSRNPLPEYPGTLYRLAVTATVDAAGRTWPMNLAHGTLTQTYAAQFVPVEAGQHQLTVRATTHDADNKLIEVFSGVVGEFTVEPVALQSLGLQITRTCSLQQGDDLRIAYQTVSPGNKGVQISPAIKWELATQVGTKTLAIVPQGPDSAGLYSASIKLDDAGKYHLMGDAKLLEPIGGVERVLLTEDQEFDVAPVQKLAIRIVAPDSGSTVGRTNTWQPTPLNIEVWLTDPDGTLIVPDKYLQSPVPDVPLELIVSTPDGRLVPGIAPLAITVDKGRYQAQIEGLPLGEYDLIIRPVSGLSTQCGWQLPADARARISRVDNPVLIAEVVGLVIILAVLLLLLITALRLRQHPCRGWVTILRADGEKIGDPAFPMDLDRRGFNYIVVRHGDLGETAYDRMELFCRDAEKHEKYILELTVYYKGSAAKREKFGPREIIAGPGLWDLPNGFKFKYVKKEGDLG
jgi:hypothetical protein